MMPTQVLIIGGTGSLGNALARALLAQRSIERVAVLSRDELKQSEMAGRIGPDPRLRYFLGDVRDRDRLHLAMRGIDTVIHAAALKQVPALEYNPTEGIRTNVMGSINVCAAALEAGVERVLAVSTDKASQPVTLYGATKLCMERLVLAANSYAGREGPRYSCVRYGNVAGSRGSIVPVWRELLRQGKPLPITDVRMTRFHIRMEDAVALVMRALMRMKGGEVFIPRLPSFRIVDLWRVVTRSGPADEPDHVIGRRPGEKLHESLIGPEEAHDAYDLGDDYALLYPVAGESRPRIRANRVAEGFVYSSDRNDRWLKPVDLHREFGAMLHMPEAAA